jgi:hypothetical protein
LITDKMTIQLAAQRAGPVLLDRGGIGDVMCG